MRRFSNITKDSAVGSNGAERQKAPNGERRSHESFMHFLVCARSAMSYEVLRSLLLSTPPFLGSDLDPKLRIMTVPLFPPTSEDQAKQWSWQYWPTAYKGGNQFGPHPALVARATQEIENQVEEYMGLAMRAGQATSTSGVGVKVGAVVVDRTQGKDAAILAAAGDARWQGSVDGLQQAGANAMAHSVMRVIGMIARKRRSLLVERHSNPQSANAMNFFADEPLTSLEKDVYDNPIVAGGYLCLDLELYITHEPCVMCCMAINHSRFGRVVFGERMPTGGLTTEKKDNDGSDDKYVAYGLWWRQELNWKFLTWQWVGKDNSQIAVNAQPVHA